MESRHVSDLFFIVSKILQQTFLFGYVSRYLISYLTTESVSVSRSNH